MTDSHIFKHLRKKHGAESGGKNKLRDRPINLTPLTIRVTGSHVRELMARKIQFEFIDLIRKLQKLNAFNKSMEPTLHVKRSPQQNIMVLTVIIHEVLPVLYTFDSILGQVKFSLFFILQAIKMFRNAVV